MCTKLKEEYLKKLETLKEEHINKALNYEKEGSSDEAVFEKIKENIIDVFYSVFNVSYNKTCKITNEGDRLEKLSETYYGFFDKIPNPWKAKMAKDKEHNNIDEYYKEKVKLDMANEIKDLFTNYYEKYKMED